MSNPETRRPSQLLRNVCEGRLLSESVSSSTAVRYLAIHLAECETRHHAGVSGPTNQWDFQVHREPRRLLPHLLVTDHSIEAPSLIPTMHDHPWLGALPAARG